MYFCVAIRGELYKNSEILCDFCATDVLLSALFERCLYIAVEKLQILWYNNEKTLLIEEELYV